MTELESLRARSPLELPTGLWVDVEAAYSSPGRVYHTLRHIVDAATHFHAVGREERWDFPGESYVALLFHDAVYEIGSSDNEERAAQRAVASVKQWVPERNLDVQRIRRLILLTARHGKLQPGDVRGDEARFVDCDMAILGAPPTEFSAYDQAIAAEYATVPPALFDQGRRAFLQKLLDLPRIFHDDFFYGRLESQARSNLLRTLLEGRLGGFRRRI